MDNCIKCDGYSGGGSLCLVCEKAALKKNARKPRRKKPDPIFLEMLSVLKQIQCNSMDPENMFESDCVLSRLIARAEARLK